MCVQVAAVCLPGVAWRADGVHFPAIRIMDRHSQLTLLSPPTPHCHRSTKEAAAEAKPAEEEPFGGKAPAEEAPAEQEQAPAEPQEEEKPVSLLREQQHDA